VETWAEIIPIIRKQRIDPDYQFVPELAGQSQPGV
jgi:hypothetical protein